MTAPDWLRALTGACVVRGRPREVTAVCYDSRQATSDCLFVAVPGATPSSLDGHHFIPQALTARAAAVIVQEDRRPVWETILAQAPVAVVSVPDSRVALAQAAAAFYGYPARRLGVVGVTGTDGKTTTVHLIAALLEAGGLPTAYLSSAELRAGGTSRLNDTHMTTLESPEVQALLAEAVAAGDRMAVLEASSHGLALHRVDECEFDVAVFTNLTPDHLDFHGTMDEYREAKGRLFSMLDVSVEKGVPKAAVINADDPACAFFRGLTRFPTLAYSVESEVDVWAEGLRSDGLSMRFRLHTPGGSAQVCLPLPGAFNVYNALAAAAVARTQGVALADIARGLDAFPGVPGRLERIEAGQPFAVIVDIASTAPALRNVLGVLRPATAGRLVVVFGCAGERDPGRREGMGRVAAELADFAVLTNEDPRSEDPDAIIDAIAQAMTAAGRREGEDFVRVPDRREAIACAFQGARPGDTVLLAGKGTEPTMVFGRRHVPWNERAVARELLSALI